ncbi:MAG TPA: hypothetical protein VLN57_21060 [Xanthobacteraceae bacterium]|nr:hypothetical protein [Xanthobacteraceae bacterium]
MIAALFVQRDGVYFGIPDVDPWDEERDARLYAGPFPVVAHPPCARWCRLAALVESTGGAKRGDDGGCFAAALASVRAWGGVLEHPAWSEAWPAFGLTKPRARGWQRTMDGGFVASVDQGAYGHLAPKATWLYAFGVAVTPLRTSRPKARMVVTTSRRQRGHMPEMPKSQRSRTPLEFRDVLLDMARAAGQA